MVGAVSRTYTIRDWLDSICNLCELLSLSEDELVQLEEIEGDLALTAAWWRRRWRRRRTA
jgi:sugar/nucleoside kinase (ribokinase family)